MTSSPRLDRIEAALSKVFPPGVACAARLIGLSDPDTLWPAERRAVAGAVPHRIAEFTAGRDAARAALRKLGFPATALPMRPDRAPAWPAGISGSVAHAAGIAVAVARIGAPLGVDLEEDMPLPADLWPVLTSQGERDPLPVGDRGRLIRHVFVAKEAVFKAQTPESRALFGFDAVEVALAEDRFDAQFRTDAGAFRAGDTIRGQIAVSEGLVFAGVAR